MPDVAEKVKIIEETDIDTEIEEPSQYGVIFHNDNRTPVDFVISLITVVFDKPIDVAERLTWDVHHGGKAIIAIYDYDIAEQKKAECDNASNLYGFPLKVSVEEQQ